MVMERFQITHKRSFQMEIVNRKKWLYLGKRDIEMA